MAELTIDMTYGSAMFQAAAEAGREKKILEEANEVLEIFKREPDFYAFVNNPTISAAEKKRVLATVFEGKIDEQLLNLLCILVDKGRSRHFPKIVKSFRTLADKEQGVSYGTIYSVKPLSPGQIKKFETEAGRLIKEKVKLENETDASLIGGIKILIDGKIIDASLRSRLEDMSGIIK